jgi:hypothetical protein
LKNNFLGILTGTLWIVDEISEEVQFFAEKLMIIPIFFFRMISWQIILIVLGSFSIGTCVGFIFVNSLLLFFVQDKLILEPIYFACLSLFFPIHRMPSTKKETNNNNNNNKSMKILFLMILTGFRLYLVS